MQSKISGDALFEYKLYNFSRNIYCKCSEIKSSLSKIKFKEILLSLKVHSVISQIWWICHYLKKQTYNDFKFTP